MKMKNEKSYKVFCLVFTLLVAVIICLCTSKRLVIGDYKVHCYGFFNAEIISYYGNGKDVCVPKRILFWNIKKIGSKCFSENSEIESVNIPDTIEEINFGVFQDCVSLKKVYFEPSIKLEYIPDDMCSGCMNLEEVSLPQGIEKIGEEAFENCRALSEITLVDGITDIKHGAFMNCTGLTKVDFPETLKEISDNAFKGCSSLTSVSFSAGLKYIEDSAFENCTSLDKVILPNSLWRIGSKAFGGCTNLHEVTIDEGHIKTIASDAFDGTPFLKNNDYVIIGNYLYAYIGDEESISIPEGITAGNTRNIFAKRIEYPSGYEFHKGEFSGIEETIEIEFADENGSYVEFLSKLTDIDIIIYATPGTTVWNDAKRYGMNVIEKENE